MSQAQHVLRLYRSKKTGQWRWSHHAPNTKQVGGSGQESYRKRSACIANMYVGGGWVVRIVPKRTQREFVAYVTLADRGKVLAI